VQVYAVAISPERRLLASGSSDGTIKLWSLPDGALLKTIPGGPAAAVSSVAISPDGRLLVSGAGQAIELWSLPDGNQLPVCLMDPAASAATTLGATYTMKGATYSVPCGTPFPTGAVCTCNCVPGTSCGCVNCPGGGCQVFCVF
jgi:WD40 repeat protein